MSEFTMTIDGKSVPSETSFPVINPATGEAFAQAPECSEDDLNAAFAAAAAALGDWSRDENYRRECLRALATMLVESADALAPLIVAEQGKPLEDARIEALYSAAICTSFADLEIPREIIIDTEHSLVEVLRHPVGVVAAITPWNFPLILAFSKIAPALMAGTTLVLKPSPFTPLTTLRIGEMMSSVLPHGVVNVVSGGDALGAMMTAHPTPRKITFTGSIEAGKKVAMAAAADLKRVTLELGGNDAAIVLDDADPALIAKGIFGAAFANNGQVCAAIKRVYVPTKLKDQLVEALAEEARGAVVGDGLDPKTTLGPINNRPQFDRVKELVAEALHDGATAVTGGQAYDRPGYFFEPTIITGAADDARIVVEEQFGPALPVIGYDDLEGAISAANSTNYGLSASVWGSDADRATEVASRMEAGTAWVNTHLATDLGQPFGGAKWSGIGVENGLWGLNEFREILVVHRAR
jgi:acyl-CoA reductase-like NAD-dependent aldehyde dehydrogenase